MGTVRAADARSEAPPMPMPPAQPHAPTGEEDPRVTRSRALILAAALEHFQADGYVGTSVDAIAATAGVSKRTVYNIYEGKEALFRAVLQEAIDTAESFARTSGELATRVQDSQDLGADLQELAVRQATAVLGGRVVPLRRLLIGEAERFPDLADEYYQRAPGRVMGALAELFARVAAHGLLEVEDPQVAAEHFSFLVMGAHLDRALFRTSADVPSVDDVTQRARAGARAFLRAYAP